MICDYTGCRHNAASNNGTKRYGTKCLHRGGCLFMNRNVQIILKGTVTHADWNPAILSEGELKYCIFKEKRKSAIVKLQAELKQRAGSENPGQRSEIVAANH